MVSILSGEDEAQGRAAELGVIFQRVGRNLMVNKDILLNGIVVGEHGATGDNLDDAKAAQVILEEKGLHQETITNDEIFN